MNSTLIPALCVLLLAPVPFNVAFAQSASAGLPTLTFTKEFPGSSPDYYSIALRQDGEALYRIALDEKPTSFQVSAESTDQIFALAQKLNLFDGANLESKRKVAHMGRKTLLFENGDDRGEVFFNHTENADALALTALFERLSTTQQHRVRIEYLLRFDKLGIVKELLQLEMDLDRGRLLEPALLLPLLERVQTNRALVKVAQQRAAGIIAKLQSGAY
ncbi:MAG: hypothetical protein HYX73_02965 [Acidobacteria bacterium]|nr:hypothetical protein [Acidobacteriota bacterium]